MFEKIYGMLWATIAIIAMILLVTGNFTLTTLVALGFVSFGMIFMGMMCVLPSMVGQLSAPPEPKKIRAAPEKSGIFESKHLATR
jgi:hypothetical protein